MFIIIISQYLMSALTQEHLGKADAGRQVLREIHLHHDLAVHLAGVGDVERHVEAAVRGQRDLAAVAQASVGESVVGVAQAEPKGDQSVAKSAQGQRSGGHAGRQAAGKTSDIGFCRDPTNQD
jgi:hypothetical protein